MKNERKVRMKRAMCMLLSLVMMLGMLPGCGTTSVSALSDTCPNHQTHDESCGYVEAVEGSPCTHEHTDECYSPVLICEKQEHTHGPDCYDEDGKLICELEEHTHGYECYSLICGKVYHKHTDECYTVNEDGEKVLTCTIPEHEHSDECLEKVLDCKHVHDESCGYVEAVEGSPCTHSCELCDGSNREEEAPAEEETPAEEEAPAEEDTPADGETPADEESPVDEETPADGETPADAPVTEILPLPMEDGGVTTQENEDYGISLKWVDYSATNGSNDTYFLEDNGQNDMLTLTYSLNIWTSGGISFDKDNFEVRIPNTLLDFRQYIFEPSGTVNYNYSANTTGFSIPTIADADAQNPNCRPFGYEIDETTNELVIRNSKESVPAAANINIQFSFSFYKRNLKDGQTATLQATTSKATGNSAGVATLELPLQESNEITFEEDLKGSISSLTKEPAGAKDEGGTTDTAALQGGRLHAWPSYFGTEPENFEDSRWVAYKLYGDLSGNNPGYYHIEDVPGSGGEVYALKLGDVIYNTDQASAVAHFNRPSETFVTGYRYKSDYWMEDIDFDANDNGSLSLTLNPFGMWDSTNSYDDFEKDWATYLKSDKDNTYWINYFEAYIVVKYPLVDEGEPLENELNLIYEPLDGDDIDEATASSTIYWKDYDFNYAPGKISIAKLSRISGADYTDYGHSEAAIAKLKARSNSFYANFRNYDGTITSAKALISGTKGIMPSSLDMPYYDFEIGDDAMYIQLPDGSPYKLQQGDYYINFVAFLKIDCSETDTSNGVVTKYDPVDFASQVTVQLSDDDGVTWDNISLTQEQLKGYSQIPLPSTTKKYTRIRVYLKDVKAEAELKLSIEVGIILEGNGKIGDVLRANNDIHSYDVLNFAYVKLYGGAEGSTDKEWTLGPNEDNYDPAKIGEWLSPALKANDIEEYGAYVQRAKFVSTLLDSKIIGSYEKGVKALPDPVTGVKRYSNEITFLDLFDSLVNDDVLNESWTMADYQDSVDLYSPYTGEMILYDLLPKGMTIDLSTVVVTDASYHYYNIDPSSNIPEMISNYEGTGRTMLIFHIRPLNGSLLSVGSRGTSTIQLGSDESRGLYLKNGFYVYFESEISSAKMHLLTENERYNFASVQYADAAQNMLGTDTSFLCSDYRSSLEGSANPTVDDGSAYYSFGFKKPSSTDWLMANLRGRAEASTIKDTLSRSAQYPFNDTVAMENSAYVQVQGDPERGAQFVQNTSASIGNNYVYKDSAIVGIGYTKDLVLFNFLEDAQKMAGDTQSWQGTLEKIDLSYFYALGIKPKLYYTTTPVSYTDAPDKTFAHGDPVDPIWTTEVPESSLDANHCFTIPDADKGHVTAIAVDLGLKDDGTPCVFSTPEELYMLLTMRAPSSLPEATTAYNKIIMRNRYSASGSTYSDQPHNITAYTTVVLKDRPSIVQYSVDKEVSGPDRDTNQLYDYKTSFTFDVTNDAGVSPDNVYKIHYDINLADGHDPAGYGALSGDFYLGNYPEEGLNNISGDGKSIHDLKEHTVQLAHGDTVTYTFSSVVNKDSMTDIDGVWHLDAKTEELDSHGMFPAYEETFGYRVVSKGALWTSGSLSTRYLADNKTGIPSEGKSWCGSDIGYVSGYRDGYTHFANRKALTSLTLAKIVDDVDPSATDDTLYDFDVELRFEYRGNSSNDLLNKAFLVKYKLNLKEGHALADYGLTSDSGEFLLGSVTGGGGSSWGSSLTAKKTMNNVLGKQLKLADGDSLTFEFFMVAGCDSMQDLDPELDGKWSLDYEIKEHGTSGNVALFSNTWDSAEAATNPIGTSFVGGDLTLAYPTYNGTSWCSNKETTNDVYRTGDVVYTNYKDENAKLTTLNLTKHIGGTGADTDKAFPFDVELYFYYDYINKSDCFNKAYRVEYTVTPKTGHDAEDCGVTDETITGEFFLGNISNGGDQHPSFDYGYFEAKKLTSKDIPALKELKLADGDRISFEFYSVYGERSMENMPCPWSLRYTISETGADGYLASYTSKWNGEAAATNPYGTATKPGSDLFTQASWCRSTYEPNYSNADVDFFNSSSMADLTLTKNAISRDEDTAAADLSRPFLFDLALRLTSDASADELTGDAFLVTYKIELADGHALDSAPYGFDSNKMSGQFYLGYVSGGGSRTTADGVTTATQTIDDYAILRSDLKLAHDDKITLSFYPLSEDIISGNWTLDYSIDETGAVGYISSFTNKWNGVDAATNPTGTADRDDVGPVLAYPTDEETSWCSNGISRSGDVVYTNERVVKDKLTSLKLTKHVDGTGDKDKAFPFIVALKFRCHGDTEAELADKDFRVVYTVTPKEGRSAEDCGVTNTTLTGEFKLGNTTDGGGIISFSLYSSYADLSAEMSTNHIPGLENLKLADGDTITFDLYPVDGKDSMDDLPNRWWLDYYVKEPGTEDYLSSYTCKWDGEAAATNPSGRAKTVGADLKIDYPSTFNKSWCYYNREPMYMNADIDFYNTKALTEFTLTKTVTGDDADTTTPYQFDLNFKFTANVDEGNEAELENDAYFVMYEIKLADGHSLDDADYGFVSWQTQGYFTLGKGNGSIDGNTLSATMTFEDKLYDPLKLAHGDSLILRFFPRTGMNSMTDMSGDWSLNYFVKEHGAEGYSASYTNTWGGVEADTHPSGSTRPGSDLALAYPDPEKAEASWCSKTSGYRNGKVDYKNAKVDNEALTSLTLTKLIEGEGALKTRAFPFNVALKFKYTGDTEAELANKDYRVVYTVIPDGTHTAEDCGMTEATLSGEFFLGNTSDGGGVIDDKTLTAEQLTSSITNLKKLKLADGDLIAFDFYAVDGKDSMEGMTGTWSLDYEIIEDGTAGYSAVFANNWDDAEAATNPSGTADAGVDLTLAYPDPNKNEASWCSKTSGYRNAAVVYTNTKEALEKNTSLTLTKHIDGTDEEKAKAFPFNVALRFKYIGDDEAELNDKAYRVVYTVTPKAPHTAADCGVSALTGEFFLSNVTGGGGVIDDKTLTAEQLTSSITNLKKLKLADGDTITFDFYAVDGKDSMEDMPGTWTLDYKISETQSYEYLASYTNKWGNAAAATNPSAIAENVGEGLTLAYPTIGSTNPDENQVSWCGSGKTPEYSNANVDFYNNKPLTDLTLTKAVVSGGDGTIPANTSLPFTFDLALRFTSDATGEDLSGDAFLVKYAIERPGKTAQTGTFYLGNVTDGGTTSTSGGIFTATQAIKDVLGTELKLAHNDKITLSFYTLPGNTLSGNWTLDYYVKETGVTGYLASYSNAWGTNPAATNPSSPTTTTAGADLTLAYPVTGSADPDENQASWCTNNDIRTGAVTYTNTTVKLDSLTELTLTKNVTGTDADTTTPYQFDLAVKFKATGTAAELKDAVYLVKYEIKLAGHTASEDTYGFDADKLTGSFNLGNTTGGSVAPLNVEKTIASVLGVPLKLAHGDSITLKFYPVAEKNSMTDMTAWSLDYQVNEYGATGYIASYKNTWGGGATATNPGATAATAGANLTLAYPITDSENPDENQASWCSKSDGYRTAEVDYTNAKQVKKKLTSLTLTKNVFGAEANEDLAFPFNVALKFKYTGDDEAELNDKDYRVVYTVNRKDESDPELTGEFVLGNAADGGGGVIDDKTLTATKNTTDITALSGLALADGDTITFDFYAVVGKNSMEGMTGTWSLDYQVTETNSNGYLASYTNMWGALAADTNPSGTAAKAGDSLTLAYPITDSANSDDNQTSWCGSDKANAYIDASVIYHNTTSCNKLELTKIISSSDASFNTVPYKLGLGLKYEASGTDAELEDNVFLVKYEIALADGHTISTGSYGFTESDLTGEFYLGNYVVNGVQKGNSGGSNPISGGKLTATQNINSVLGKNLKLAHGDKIVLTFYPVPGKDSMAGTEGNWSLNYTATELVPTGFTSSFINAWSSGTTVNPSGSAASEENLTLQYPGDSDKSWCNQTDGYRDASITYYNLLPLNKLTLSKKVVGGTEADEKLPFIFDLNLRLKSSGAAGTLTDDVLLVKYEIVLGNGHTLSGADYGFGADKMKGQFYLGNYDVGGAQVGMDTGALVSSTATSFTAERSMRKVLDGKDLKLAHGDTITFTFYSVPGKDQMSYGTGNWALDYYINEHKTTNFLPSFTQKWSRGSAVPGGHAVIGTESALAIEYPTDENASWCSTTQQYRDATVTYSNTNINHPTLANLTLTKNVAGANANKDQLFDFDVALRFKCGTPKNDMVFRVEYAITLADEHSWANYGLAPANRSGEFYLGNYVVSGAQVGTDDSANPILEDGTMFAERTLSKVLGQKLKLAHGDKIAFTVSSVTGHNSMQNLGDDWSLDYKMVEDSSKVITVLPPSSITTDATALFINTVGDEAPTVTSGAAGAGCTLDYPDEGDSWCSDEQDGSGYRDADVLCKNQLPLTTFVLSKRLEQVKDPEKSTELFDFKLMFRFLVENDAGVSENNVFLVNYTITLASGHNISDYGITAADTTGSFYFGAAEGGTALTNGGKTLNAEMNINELLFGPGNDIKLGHGDKITFVFYPVYGRDSMEDIEGKWSLDYKLSEKTSDYTTVVSKPTYYTALLGNSYKDLDFLQGPMTGGIDYSYPGSTQRYYWASSENEDGAMSYHGYRTTSVAVFNTPKAVIRVQKLIKNIGTSTELQNKIFFIQLASDGCTANTQVALKHSEVSYDMFIGFIPKNSISTSRASATIDVSEIVPMEFSKDYTISVINYGESKAVVTPEGSKTVEVHPGDDVTIVVTNTFEHTDFFKSDAWVKNILPAN